MSLPDRHLAVAVPVNVPRAATVTVDVAVDVNMSVDTLAIGGDVHVDVSVDTNVPVPGRACASWNCNALGTDRGEL